MDVAEELLDLDGTVDRAYVTRRLDDWCRRVDRLYADIDGWLPDGWSMGDGGTVQIFEDLMQRFDVPARTLPVKSLFRQRILAGRVEPRGLWIIGANGRVDLILPDAHYLIVDRVDSFEPSNWQVATLMKRREQRPFNRDFLSDVLL